MSGCKITDNAIRYVAGYCARLVTLNVKECDMLTDYTVTGTANRCAPLSLTALCIARSLAHNAVPCDHHAMQ
jgi:hypothetical protein